MIKRYEYILHTFKHIKSTIYLVYNVILGVDASGKGLLYNGILDCFVKIFKTEGVVGFYKGITANYMRLGPHGALCLVFWDILKDWQKKFTNSDKISR